MVNVARPVFNLFFRQMALALAIWLSTAAAVSAEPLTFSYFDRPPYYYTSESGDPGGFLFERTRNILQEAGGELNFIASTPYRILYVLRHATVPHCSIGWFKTAERELFAKFSEPIYRNQALLLLTSKTLQHKFPARTKLRDIFSDQQLTIARMGEFTYGRFVDDLLGELTPKSVFFTGNQSALLQAVADQRADYMLVAPEEIEMLARSVGLPIEELVTIKLADIPVGNLRYLMCSQAVSDETITQLNAAINKLYPLSSKEQ